MVDKAESEQGAQLSDVAGGDHAVDEFTGWRRIEVFQHRSDFKFLTRRAMNIDVTTTSAKQQLWCQQLLDVWKQSQNVADSGGTWYSILFDTTHEARWIRSVAQQRTAHLQRPCTREQVGAILVGVPAFRNQEIDGQRILGSPKEQVKGLVSTCVIQAVLEKELQRALTIILTTAESTKRTHRVGTVNTSLLQLFQQPLRLDTR